MARRHPIVRGFLLLALVGLGLAGVLLAFAALTGGGLAGRLSLGPTVGVMELRGVIADATDALETLDRFRRSDATMAVVLRIDSPGGAVAPSQELYDAVWRLRDVKPVVASLGNVAASGGYYVASAANVIVADPGTITGSIGAIMSVPLYASLADKIGVSEQIVKSGQFKDTGHPFRPMTTEERAVLQGMVDDVLRQFVDAVARGRGMEPAQVRALADGRIYSGAQARAAGLVDILGGLDAALGVAWERAGQSGEPKSYQVRLRRRTWWLELLGELIPEPRGVAGGLLFLYQGPALE